MLPPDTRCGPVWRIAPMGTTQCYLVTLGHTQARVHSRGQVGKWAKQAMTVDLDDLFLTKPDALAEYRRRKNTPAGDPVNGQRPSD